MTIPKYNKLEGLNITKCKYDFSEVGIGKMYTDSLTMIFSALSGENPDFTIDELDINISIGDKEITIPLQADVFEELFRSLNEINNILEGDI